MSQVIAREHSERIILKFLRSALAKYLKAAGVRYALAHCLVEPAANEASAG
jgi:hypothetical protein